MSLLQKQHVQTKTAIKKNDTECGKDIYIHSGSIVAA